MRQLSLRVCLSVFTVIAAQFSALGDEVVVPNALESAEGSRNNSFPFNLDAANEFGIYSMRYQQVYAADEVASQPVLITEIRFRPDGIAGDPFNSVLPDIQITLSSTSAAPDGLSSTFADNLGPDQTIVHNGALSLSSADTGPGPSDFDIVIVLTVPFLYDPSQGNLLMDVQNFGGGATTGFDAESIEGDSVSRAFTSVSTDVNSPNAEFTSSFGLVTKFVYTAAGAPPPASLPVVIDVKPGSDDNQVNLKDTGISSSSSHGKGKAIGQAKGTGNSTGGPVLQVAILTTDGYDASLTDVGTVLLGDPLLGGSTSPIRSILEDVDADGDLDVLMHFSLGGMQDANAISADSMLLVLTAETIDGIAIDGMDAVNVK